MKNPKLAGRYAKALFDIALGHHRAEEAGRDLALVKVVLSQSRDLTAVLNSPVIPPAKKHAIFTAVFKDKLSDITFAFLDVVIRKKREPMLTDICREYAGLYNEYRGIRTATLTTAVPISPELTERIRQMLADATHYDISIGTAVQPELLGGIIIRTGDFYFNASLRAKVNRLKKAFAHNEYQVNF